jgi:hypothetical protein
VGLEHSVSANTPGDSPLNDPQLRHFEVSLSMLETALDEVDVLAAIAPSNAGQRLIGYDADLPDGFATKARSAGAAIRIQIGLLARNLNIQSQRRSTLRTAKAILTAELVRLDDSYSGKLRGYGAVSPRAKTEIDPILDTIRRELVALLHACDADGSTRNPTPPIPQ